MKTLYRFSIAVFCCLFITSCEKMSNVAEVEKELMTVKLSCIGEISDIITTPLRSNVSDSKDLCAIQVHTIDANGKTTPYAYGLFDNLSDVSITLVDGVQYRFKALYLKNAKLTTLKDGILSHLIEIQNLLHLSQIHLITTIANSLVI